MPVKKGDKITVKYEGTLEDGTVFDSTKEHGEPMEFEVGSEQLIAGFDSAVVGMKKGEEKRITIEPCDAYGERNPKLTKKVPKTQLPQSEELKPGMMLMLTLPNDTQFTATVSEVDVETVTLDMNHPLAGKTLNFKIKVVKIKS